MNLGYALVSPQHKHFCLDNAYKVTEYLFQGKTYYVKCHPK